MRILNFVSSRYVYKSKTPQTMVGYSRSVISYLRSWSVSDRVQYPLGFVVLSRCTCDNSNPAWKSHASVSSMICPVEFGSARNGGDVSTSFSKIHELDLFFVEFECFWLVFLKYCNQGRRHASYVWNELSEDV